MTLTRKSLIPNLCVTSSVSKVRVRVLRLLTNVILTISAGLIVCLKVCVQAHVSYLCFKVSM